MADTTPLSHLFVRRGIVRLLFLPTLGWNFLLGRVLRIRHWWDDIDAHVIMGALPFACDVPALRRAGVGGVVNTCEEYGGPVRTYRRAGIEQLRIPTLDFHPPALADLERSVAFMQDQIARGRRVYVHCKAGRARSGTVVMCYLIGARGMTPEEAQQLILRCRPHAHRQLDQRQVVQQYWLRHGA